MASLRLSATISLIVLLGLSGCSTAPVANTTTSSAYVLGDRASLNFDEIVVSLPFSGAVERYQNLHVALAVIINPIRSTAVSDYAARDLVSRMSPRISASVSAALQSGVHHSVLSINELRAKSIAEAQGVVDKALRNWSYAPDYKVEVVVLSIYWTDASVGRQASGGAMRW